MKTYKVNAERGRETTAWSTAKVTAYKHGFANATHGTILAKDGENCEVNYELRFIKTTRGAFKKGYARGKFILEESNNPEGL